MTTKPRMPGYFLLRALCDGWTVEWRTIDALLVNCQLRRTAVILAVERHGKIERRDKEIAITVGEDFKPFLPPRCLREQALPLLGNFNHDIGRE